MWRGSLFRQPPALALVFFFFLEEIKLERIVKSSLNGEGSYIGWCLGARGGGSVPGRMEP